VQVKRAMSWLRNSGQDYQNQARTASSQILRGHKRMIYAGRDRILREVCKFLGGKKGEISNEGGGRTDGRNRLPLDIK
jgi:hypothetical protein